MKILILLSALLITFSSYSQEAFYGVNLAGAEFGENNVPGTYNVHYTYPSVNSLDYYKNKGLRLVRLPFLWERLQPVMDEPFDANELARMDAFIAGAKSKGVYVIPDMHNYGRRNVGGTRYIISSAQVPVSSYVDFWERFAQHYKNDTAIWAYGLMNEPHDMSGTWIGTVQTVINAIRAIDTEHRLLVPGDHWSSAHTWASSNDGMKNITDPADNMLFEAHQYFDYSNQGIYVNSYDADGTYPEIGADRVQVFIDWLTTNNKKGFLGEYGVPGNDPRWNTVLENFLRRLQANCIGGTYWAGGPWWGSYPLSVEPSGSTDKPQMSVLEKFNSCPPYFPTGARGMTDRISFTVFPNPSRTSVTISFDNPADATLSFLDMTGKIFYEEKIEQRGAVEKVIDLSGFSEGIYLVNIKSGEYAVSKEVVVR